MNTTVHKTHISLTFVVSNLHKCPEEIKELAYKTYARPKTEYASVVWNSFTTKNIIQLESVSTEHQDLLLATLNVRLV